MAEPLIRSFATAQEFADFRENQERDATEAMQPWQRDLQPGDRVAYGWTYEGAKEELTIYFEVLPDARTKASRMWGKGYSRACPEGELGTMWRCNALIVLTPVAWEAARCRGWPFIDFAGMRAPDGSVIERNSDG